MAADSILSALGPIASHIPGYWRLVRRLEPLAAATWDVSRVIRRDGFRYEVDMHDVIPRSICYNGCYEPGETRAAARLLRPDAIAFDIGAHIGYFTLHFSRFVGPRGTVYAFEPSPTTYSKLRRNLELNHITNVAAIPMALGDGQATVGMNTDTETKNTGHFRVSGTGDILMTTLDDFVAERGILHIDFIKVDIEGCEVKFLRGADKTLRSFRPPLLIEMNPESLDAFGHTAAELWDCLLSYGYKLFRPCRHGVKLQRSLPAFSDYINVLATQVENLACK